MTCCGCTTSKCAGSSSCGPLGYLCLSGALVWVVLRQRTSPIHPGELGVGVGGQMLEALGTKWTHHSLVSANI